MTLRAILKEFHGQEKSFNVTFVSLIFEESWAV
jgi:hypothetical protein